MILEGPIITVISGFLVTLGFLNVYVTYVLLVIGDLLGDIMHYAIGKYWGRTERIKRWGKFFGYDESHEKFLEEHFKKHTGKTLLLGKISHGVGTAVQIAAGIARVDFLEFVWYCFLGTIPKTFLLLILGLSVGSSYMKIDTYFDTIAIITTSVLILFVIGFIILQKYAKNLLIKK